MSLRLPAAAVALGLDPECRNDAGGFADAGAGGAAAPPIDAPALDSGGADPAAAAADVADPDDPDSADDPELNDAPFKDDPRFKRLHNKNRSLARRLARSRELVDTVTGLGLNAAQIREIYGHSQQFQKLLPTIQSREFLEFLSRTAEGGDTRTAERGRDNKAPQLPAFNEDDFPFDTSDPGGRALMNFAKQIHNEKNELLSLVHSLSRDVAELRNGVSGDQRQREVAVWKSTIDAAASKVPENVRDMFRDACVGAYREAQRLGRRITPQQVVDIYTKKLGLSSSAQATAHKAAAAAQRIAENNKARPGAAAFAGGTPTKAGDRSQERIGDVSKRLLGKKYYGTGRF